MPSPTPPSVPPGSPPSPPRTPARWTALSYELPADDSATRGFLWRRLRERHGLNLRHGLWALPHRPASRPEGTVDLAPVLDRLEAVGARVELRPVAREDPADDALQQLLVSACERLWTRFFTEADRLAARSPTAPAAALAPGIDALHDHFARTLARDLVQSAAIERAARRLDDLEWIEHNVRPAAAAAAAPAAAAAATAPLKAIRPSVSIASQVVMEEGVLRTVARLLPAPPLAWERAFFDFERRTYRPDELRAVVRHGTVVVTGAPEALADALARVEDRIRRFDVTGI